MSLTDYLTSLTQRLSTVEAKLGLPQGKTPIPAGPATGAAAVLAFDDFVKESVAPFVATSQKIGGKAAALGDAVNNGFAQVRAFIEMASQSKKPSDIGPVIKPVQDAILAVGALKERDEFENHAKACAEAVAAFAWVNPAITTPGPFCSDAVDAAVFWTNKVRSEWKAKEGGEIHIQWCNELSAAFKGLGAYIKANAPTGVSWNANGKEATAAAGSAPAAGAASSTAPKAAVAGAAITDVFAQLKQIDQSSGKTAGLNHVTKEMKAKNRDDRSSVVPANIEPKKPPAKKWGGGDGGLPQNVDPKFELQGMKWVVQGQTAIVELKEDQVSVKQTVYIFGCDGATVIIGGKVNTITIDGCRKTKVIFENALALVEVVNCRQVQVQVKGKCPTASVDKTDGYVLFLSYEGAGDTKIVSSKSSEMNVEIPISADPDAEYKSFAIPEQFYHKFNAEKTHLSSEVSELYTAGG